jgi:formate dehydrogenase major subunit
LNGTHPEESLEINPEDAEKLNIKNGDEISVTSRRGSLITKAQVTTSAKRLDIYYFPFH